MRRSGCTEKASVTTVVVWPSPLRFATLGTVVDPWSGLAARAPDPIRPPA